MIERGYVALCCKTVKFRIDGKEISMTMEDLFKKYANKLGYIHENELMMKEVLNIAHKAHDIFYGED